MKLIKLYLENFRGYNNIEIKFNKGLNLLIGRNDVGKSTVLDALNIFFNDEAKIDITDCNSKSSNKIMKISCSFEIDENDLIILDASNPTSLKNEYLLNKDNLLEVTKTINASGKSITKSNVQVSLNTYHPKINDKPLITYKQFELKKQLEKYKDKIEKYEEINKTKKADMRKEIFNLLIDNQTEFEDKLINIKDIEDESLRTWVKLKEQLPIYNLFQSDRTNTDGDKEVQDPMRAITKEALIGLQGKLDEIRDEVVSKVEEIGHQTIEKLSEFDNEIASQLKTLPDLKGWDSVFKFNLDTDGDIPLNKRGSGVRRLILLSYFRAQAEKQIKESGNLNIIYAIEEPETSQHPDYQKMIIESLASIAEKENGQVFITTHTPEIAQMVDKKCLIMIKKDLEGNPYVITDEDIKVSEVIDTLGILPTIHADLVICVEGKNDISFLKTINNSVDEFKEIINLEEANISIYEMGGSRLIDYINSNHFKNSNIKEFHLYDNDVPDYKKRINSLNESNDGRRTGRITKLSEMENYIPIKLIENHFECDLSEYKSRWKTFDIPKHLTNISMQEISNNVKRENAIKGILNSTLTQEINAELLKEHRVYEEIESWFKEIKAIYDSTAAVVGRK